MRLGRDIRGAALLLTATLAVSGGMAALVTRLGTTDLENYETAFVSLDRGTAMPTIQVLGHPVYTLAIGLGVRLPLHGSLGASPAALVAPYVSEPFSYWLLMTLAMAAAVLVVRHALAPMCGRVVAWLAAVLLFWSVPLVNYTITDDWPETAVTYCAVVACAFAPHALLAVWSSRRSWRGRIVAGLSVAGLVCGLIGASHPGYWPVLAGTLACTAVLAVMRDEYPMRARVSAIAVLAVAAIVAVALQVPDITREIGVAGGALASMSRVTEGPTGSLLRANLFPFGDDNARGPFTFLLMTLASLVIGVQTRDVRQRRLIVGAAAASLACGIGAVTLVPGSVAFAPSSTWALRDPAIAFAVLSAACAAGALQATGGRRAGVAAGLAVLLLGAMQGPLFAAHILERPEAERRFDRERSPSGRTPAAARASTRGLAGDQVARKGRLALWPDVRIGMRTMRRASTDLADAGYMLVTAATKQRTMVGLVEPNGRLFGQTTDLSAEVLCDARVVEFLQLRYLLTPPGAGCDIWRPQMPHMVVDDRLDVQVATVVDNRVRALPRARLSAATASGPALSAGSSLWSELSPVPGTSVTVGPRDVVVEQEHPSGVTDTVLVLPVAYDSAWVASTGEVHEAGGLVAIVGAAQPHVVLTFVPDTPAVLRAIAMTLGQMLTCLGLLGLLLTRPSAAGD